jgi:hypothetical protein
VRLPSSRTRASHFRFSPNSGHIAASQRIDAKGQTRTSISIHAPQFVDLAATTLCAARGRRMPLSANSPTGSTVTVSSTAISTRGLIRICPDLASSQRRDATLDTVPMAA